jgi:hypothetical protein
LQFYYAKYHWVKVVGVEVLEWTFDVGLGKSTKKSDVLSLKKE